MGGTISTHAINASLYTNLPYDPVKDFVAITLIARVPNMLVVNNDITAKDVAELIKLMKANPGQVELRVRGQRHVAASVGRAVQGHGRRARCSTFRTRAARRRSPT